ncbi:MAG: tyrosine-type recombinase/integrase [Candidatus Bathyarchaeia archaeon]
MVEASALSPNIRPEAGNSPCCPECGSPGPFRDGLRYLADGSAVQRFLCRFCGFRFSWPRVERRRGSVNFKRNADVTIGGCSSRVQALLERRMEGLVDGQMENGQRAAGATEQRIDVHGKIVEFLWWMKKQGYKETTIFSRGQRLKRLINLGADLFNPESVKEVIAKQDKWKESRKQAMVFAYDLFAGWMGLKWERPIYKPASKLPYIPLEREIDDLIACCNQYIAAFLRIAKETGARAGEIYGLKWVDMDFERQTIRITAEKGSNPRIFRISNTLVAMLNKLPRDSDYIFHHYGSLNYLRRSFERYRKRAAFKLGNPRLLQITFHTLRHWKATMEYAKTKDILHTMQVLGHKNIKNTLIYTQLVKTLSEDEYICRVAKSPSEVQELIEAGFEYVCAKDDMLFFRKRK